MDTWLDSLNRSLKNHDRLLVARRDDDGKTSIYRERDSRSQALSPGPLKPHYLFSLTENWKQDGKPIWRGILPTMEFIQGADGWNQDKLAEARENREEQAAISKRSHRNESRAIAADLRHDFAKVTNEFVIGSANKHEQVRNEDLSK